MMSMLLKTLALVVAVFAMPAVAVTFSSRARRERYPTDWMSEAQLRDTYDGVDIAAMLEEGVLEKRQNPDLPERVQYYVKAGAKLVAKNRTAEAAPVAGEEKPAPSFSESWNKDWISAAMLYNRYDDVAIDRMLARGALEMRQSPDMPERYQYFVKDPAAADAKDGELDVAPPGLTALVTEDDYQTVAAQRNDAMMKELITRVASEMHLRVADEGGLNGLVPFFSGTTSVQCLEQMKAELLQAPWVTTATADVEHTGSTRAQIADAATLEASAPQATLPNASEPGASAPQPIAQNATMAEAPERNTHEFVFPFYFGQALEQAHVSAATQQKVATLMRRIQGGESPYDALTSSLRSFPFDEQVKVLLVLNNVSGSLSQQEMR